MGKRASKKTENSECFLSPTKKLDIKAIIKVFFNVNEFVKSFIL